MSRLFILSAVLLGLLLAGCAASLPYHKVAMPWSRVLASDNAVPAGAEIYIRVVGETLPLMGNENLTGKYIRDTAQELLERRGFKVTGDSSQYVMVIHYKTEKEIKNVTINKTTNNTYETESSYEMHTSHAHHSHGDNHDDDSEISTAVAVGLGVLLAAALVASIVSNNNERNYDAETTDTDTDYTKDTYRQILGVEIFDPQKEQVWKADIDWTSNDVDIINQSRNGFQIVFSSLPNDNSVLPDVPLVREDKFDDYFDNNIGSRAFHSPAVPYYIRFDAFRRSYNEPFIVKNVQNRQALAAYLDLLKTAEFAVPALKNSEWKNPKDRRIWCNITLGGRYTLGGGEPVNVIIRLVSNAGGYTVTGCSLVSDDEYAKYEARLAKWKQTLQDYYDYYGKDKIIEN